MFKPVDPKIKTAWVAALRSGEYTQGQRALRQRDPITGKLSYCCVGVGCNIISHRKGWMPRDGHLTVDGPKTVYDWRNEYTASTTEGLDWLDDDAYRFLADVNDDDKPWAFDRIADWIDENL